MKKHGNTLYVTTQGTYLATEGETVVAKIDREIKTRVPMHLLNGIVCFGRISCSPQLMGKCADRDVFISFLTMRGRFIARVKGPVSGNVLLRRKQYRLADDPVVIASIARVFVAAKIVNCRHVILRALRDHRNIAGEQELRSALQGMKRSLSSLDRKQDLDVIRGIEGDAASTYWGVMKYLILRNRDRFGFERRSRRPPKDPVNALLSFCYTLLAHDVASALEAVGLDPQVGYLHRDRPGRPGLALDLMEELRPVMGDRTVLSVINRGQVQASGFHDRENGGVHMDDDTRKAVLFAYQKRKEDTITHPFLGDRTTVGMLPHLQALLLARYFRGDIDGYPPFLWR